ncbi:MAG TPA: efflux RND transporter periplasmic adaptor subunit [Deltaproteobacteria bacterium]|nr:efflux RND transporter periplasmic adaptor subunit [Deltaproteobacteria bacterium]
MTSEVLPKNKIGNASAHKPAHRRIQPMDWAMIVSISVILGIFVYTSMFTREFTVNVVSVVQEYPYQIYTRFSTAGVVAAKRRVDITAKTTGQLVEFAVEEGSLVTKGQVIARLESADAAAQRDQIEAKLKLAVANLEHARVDLAEESLNVERYKKLFEMGSVSRAEYKAAEGRYRKALSAVDAAEASIKAESAALRGAEVALEYTQIKAPFSGVVLSLNAEVGDVVTPLGPAGGSDSSVATVVDVSSFSVEVTVPGAHVGEVQRGQPCAIVIDGLLGEYFTGEVSSIEPRAEKGNADFTVKVRFLEYDPRIRPDAAARVSFLSHPVSRDDDAPRMVVHKSAVVTVPGGYGVYLVKDDRAVLKKVRIGKRFDNRVEILGGVSVGDMLVANPPEGLKNGSRLMVNI